MATLFERTLSIVDKAIGRSEDPTPSKMLNLRMAEMLRSGECLDVRKEGEQITEAIFRLRRFVEDVDYCDAARELWIVSIGRDLETGEILASTFPIYYQNPAYECLFLR